jgi:predicted kinase
VSTLFFVGDRVYKQKKPVRNGFLDFTELRCECPPEMVADRTRQRILRHDDPSEATPHIARRLDASAPPWAGAVLIDTSVPLGEAAGLAEAIASRR